MPTIDGDFGKWLPKLDEFRTWCRTFAAWSSLDPISISFGISVSSYLRNEDNMALNYGNYLKLKEFNYD
jgi:CRISPR/Cas system-associated endonuclease Cas1